MDVRSHTVVHNKEQKNRRDNENGRNIQKKVQESSTSCMDTKNMWVSE